MIYVSVFENSGRHRFCCTVMSFGINHVDSSMTKHRQRKHFYTLALIRLNPLPVMPSLGSSSLVANNDVMAKIWMNARRIRIQLSA